MKFPIRLFGSQWWRFALVVSLFLAVAELITQVVVAWAHPATAAGVTMLHILLPIVLATPLVWLLAVRPAVLRASRQHHRAQAVLREAPDGIVLINSQCVIESLNPAAERMLGYRAQDAVGRGCTLLVPPDDRSARHAMVQKLVTSGTRDPIHATFHFQRKNGSVFPADVVLAPTLSSGTPLYTAVIRDVSDRQARERLRAEDDARYRALARSVPVGMFRTDADGECQYVNERWCQLTGMTPDQARGKGWSGAIHPDDRDRVFREWTEAARDKRRFRSEYRFLTPNGTTTWVIGQASAEYDENGTVTGFAGSVTDITARVEAEERLLASEREMTAIVASLQDTVFRLSPDGVITWISPAARSLFDMPLVSLVGQPLSSFADADGILRLSKLAHGRNRLANHVVFPIRRRDKVQRWVSVCAVPWRDPDGRDAGILGSMRDITEQKLAEDAVANSMEELERRVQERTAELAEATREARAANQAKSIFLSRMSHELRTPLNAVLGFAQLAEAEAQSRDDSRGEETVREIIQAGNHLLELIDDVLDLSRIEAGELPLYPVDTDPVPLVESACMLVQPLADRYGVSVRPVQKPDTPAVIFADGARLRQIMVNLLSNAIKFNQPGGTVQVAMTLSDGRLRMDVTDDGPGIPPTLQDRLFQPFERLGADTGPVDGTGIGLVIVRRLAEMMDGTVGCESHPGKGSRFWVEFPAVATPDAVPVAGPACPITPQTARKTEHTVLYIEDNTQNTILMRRILETRNDLQVLFARDGASGIKTATDHCPDLILLDVHLPDMDGFKVFDALQSNDRTRHIPVVAVSADGFAETAEKGRKAGFSDYVTKPIEVNRFLTLLDHHLNAAAAMAPQPEPPKPSRRMPASKRRRSGTHAPKPPRR
ncbi:MAG: PAS domain S-box protein [Nitrospirota bacterium]|nr:PAS domain S-box protein [Nitrospirota bacterium]